MGLDNCRFCPDGCLFAIIWDKKMEDIYTIKETAKHLKVSERTVRRSINDLGVPIYRIGRQIRIPESSIDIIKKQDGNINGKITNTFNKIYRR